MSVSRSLLAPNYYLQGATSFPGSPATDDWCFRTDRNLLYFYDGSQWLTVNEYRIAAQQGDGGGIQPTSSATNLRFAVDQSGYVMYVVAFDCTTYSATNTGSAYWTFTANKTTAAEANTTLGSAFNTSADTAARWVLHRITVNATVDPASYPLIYIAATKTGSPTGLYAATTMTYRLVG